MTVTLRSPPPPTSSARTHPGQTITGDKNYCGRDFETDLTERHPELPRPARKGEPQRTGAHLFKPLRQVIESIKLTPKGHPDLERHGGQSPAGATAPALTRVLARPAAIWLNDKTRQPVKRSLTAVDLAPLLGGNTFTTCSLTHPDAGGLLVTIDGSKERVLHVPRASRPTPELIRTAVGVPDLDVEIVSALPWRVRGLLADRFRGGRVFLVGDAAHTVPPLGAFGLNTGIADAHNLAWKLAMVLRGEAGPALLDSYEAERRPVARRTLEQAVLRLRDPALHWDRGPGSARARATAGALNAPVVHIGYRYDSAAVIDPEPDLPSTEDVALDLDGAPGSRLPHRWVGDGLSTLDLVRSRFTLLTGAGGGRDDWRAAAEPLGLAVHTLEGASTPQAPEIPKGGALLVRPDGFVGWRAASGTAGRLGTVLDRLLGRDSGRGPRLLPRG